VINCTMVNQSTLTNQPTEPCSLGIETIITVRLELENSMIQPG
jgi:hypothetical protein